MIMQDRILDARATKIRDEVIELINTESLKIQLRDNPAFLADCQTLLKEGWQERFNDIKELSAFKPTSDNIRDYFMHSTLFQFIKQCAKEPGEIQKKLDDDYQKISSRARNLTDTVELELVWLACASNLLEKAFYLSGRNAASDASAFVKYLPIINLALILSIFAMVCLDYKPPIVSANIRNFLFPASRLGQDHRLLNRLNETIKDSFKQNANAFQLGKK
jgi:hypothetical protein